MTADQYYQITIKINWILAFPQSQNLCRNVYQIHELISQIGPGNPITGFLSRALADYHSGEHTFASKSLGTALKIAHKLSQTGYWDGYGTQYHPADAECDACELNQGTGNVDSRRIARKWNLRWQDYRDIQQYKSVVVPFTQNGATKLIVVQL